MRPLLPGEYALLGLLCVRSMYGYEMAAYFDEELGLVMPVEQGMLYTYLRNLESRQLVEWEEERVGKRPPRKRFRLTAEGRETVEAWLRSPVDRMREVRLEFLVKLYVLREVDPAAEAALVQEQIAVCERYRDDSVRRRDAVADDHFARLVASSKLSAAEATLSWLTAYREELLQASLDGEHRRG